MRHLAAALLLALSFTANAAAVRLGNDVAPVSQSVELTTDPRRDDYTGSTTIELQVKKPTRTFRFHAQDIDIRSFRLSKGERPIDAARKAGEQSTVDVTAGETLRPGRATPR